MISSSAVGDPAAVALSDDELRALAYFAIGVTSEGSDKAYQLVVAGDNPATAVVTPADNSGYTIGTLQTDLGQRPQVVPQLLAAYQAWAGENNSAWVFSAEEEREVASDLARNGGQIRRDHGRDVNPTLKQRLNAFLASDDGVTFVHERDVAQVEKLMLEVMTPLRGSALYGDLTADDQARIATIVAKAYNQNERAGGRVLAGIADGRYDTLEAVHDAVTSQFPNKPGKPDYLESGRDKALSGTETLLALRGANAASPLAAIWNEVGQEPLANPVQLRVPSDGATAASADREANYSVIKTLFLDPAASRRFIAALDVGGTSTYGDPARGGTGFYAAGNDFVLWNRRGAGWAHLEGALSSVAREDIRRRNNTDRTVDIYLSKQDGEHRLLRVDRSAALLRPAGSGQGAALLHSPPDDQRRAMHGSVRDQVRELFAGHGLAAPDDQIERLSAVVVRDARQAGMSEVTLMHFTVDRETGTPDTQGKLIAWQGEPHSAFALWTATSARDAANVDLDDVMRGYAHDRHGPEPSHTPVFQTQGRGPALS